MNPTPRSRHHRIVGDDATPGAADIQAAIDDLPDGGGTLDLVGGPVVFDRPVRVDKPNVHVVVHPHVELIVDHESDVGLFHFVRGADNAQLDGRGTLRNRRFAAGQRWVRFEDVMMPRVSGLRLIADVDGGEDGDPAVMLDFEDCFAVSVSDCFLAPNGALLGVLLRGSRYRFSIVNNIFGTLDPSGLNPGQGLLPVPRYATGALRIIGSGFGHVNDNWFWFLGDRSRPMQYALRFDRYLGGAPIAENGHVVVSGNQFEGVAAHRCVSLNGLTTAIFTRNAFGYAQGFPVNVGQAALYMTGALAVPSGVSHGSTSGVQVTNNQFHNLNGGSGASHVYADDISVCSFTGNAHNLMHNVANGKAYHFARGDGGNGAVRRCVVDGNVFHAAGPLAAGPAILLDSNVHEGISIRQNRYSRFHTFLTDLGTLVSGTKQIGDNLRLD